MKIRIFMTIFVVLFSSFHFSHQTVQATEPEMNPIETMEQTESEKSIDNELATLQEGLVDKDEEETVTQDKNSLAEDVESEALEQPQLGTDTTKQEADTKEEQQNTEKEEEVANIKTSSDQDQLLLQVGVVDDSVIDLKNKLIRLGFGGMNVNATYGSFTAQRVSEFQAYYGLAATGIADEASLAKLDEILSTPFQEGMSHADTIALKENLAKLGYGGMNINEVYGSFTTLRVSQFQADFGLKAHGIADEKTVEKVEELLAIVSQSSLQVGIRDDRVIDLKNKLNRLGFGGMNVNATYGSFTAQRVSEFQAYYGLAATGIADEATLSKLDEILSTPFQEGMSHTDTIALKENLAKLGYGGMNINEVYGSFTALRVSQFQSDFGLKAHGIADEPTLVMLNNILSSPFRDGVRHEGTIELKKKLNWLGYGGMNVNDMYGSFTALRVSQFQADHGLKAHGIADEKTLAKMDEVLSNAFQVGSDHNSVIQFKRNISSLGFGGMNINEVYGSFTAQRVSQLQAYYGLQVTGEGDIATLAKIEELLSTPFQVGQKHNDTVLLKENMTKLGFGGMNLNTTYGSFTAKRVRDLQSYYGLAVNGIADEPTLAKINEILSSPFQVGINHKDTIKLKENLTRLSFGGMNLNEAYGSFTAQRVREFQSYYGLVANGIADEVTLAKINEILSSPFQVGKNHKDTIKLKQDLTTLGYGGMNLNEAYGSFTAQRVREFQAANGLKAHGIADEVTLAKIDHMIKNQVVRIFLDPGHGGRDSGGKGYGLLEKDVALDIALRTAQVLRTQYKGVEVLLSRTTDTFVELEDRAKMANQWRANYLVSFHTNALNGNTNGFETFIHNGNATSEDIQRQRDIHNYLITRIGVRDRGMKQADFSVLRNSNMPSILIEYMFIDNLTENRLLREASYRNWLGQITAEAIAHSFNLKKK
ncbi:hypothetical protein BTR23_03745 [Alkalihalophilus pseudofirmus]|nr:hypothetical protein BTR23_03745 [Alkalihalophilus pseudofirmus]